MTTLGSLPPTSIYGTWTESVEIWAIDTDTLFDLGGVTEIELILSWQRTSQMNKFPELKLTMSGGDIVVPSMGIIQWRAELGSMASLQSGLYEARLMLTDGFDTVPIILGTISIVE